MRAIFCQLQQAVALAEAIRLLQPMPSSPLDKPARTWQFDPRQFLRTGRRDRRHAKAVVRETTGCDTDQMRTHRRVPAQRRPACAAEVALLIVIVCVMKGVDGLLAAGFYYVGSKKVRGDSKGTARAAFAVCAMTNGVQARLALDRDRRQSTGAMCNACHGAGYSSDRIWFVTLSTTTGLAKYVTVGSVPYFSRTNAFQLSVYIASASAREFQR